MLLNFVRGGRALHLWEPTYICTTTKRQWEVGLQPQSYTSPVKNKSPAPSTPFLGFFKMFLHVIRLALPLVGYITIMVDWALKINYLLIRGMNKVLPD